MTSRTSKASGRLSSASRRVSLRGDDWPGVLRDGEEEGCPFSGLRLDPDSSAITFHDALANREPNAGTGIFLIVMEAFEYTKNFLLVLRVDPDSVIPNCKTPDGAPKRSGDMDSRRRGIPILESITD